ITRKEQDEYALMSQERANAAIASGKLAEEIVAIEVGSGKRAKRVERDEHPRHETTIEGLSKLPAAFEKEGFVTAGNASGIVDGAAMLLLGTRESAKTRGKTPLGRILSWAVAGVEPSRMGIGPAPAIALALKKAGLQLADIDLLEINEAFAGQI